MPIYQYLCPSCNHKFELKQSFNDDCAVHCPKCNNGAKRLFIPVPVIFKGSGFYVTDSSKKSDIQYSPKETSETKETKAEKKDEPTTPTSTSNPQPAAN
jgi:putative FmdB family regulatory protein